MNFPRLGTLITIPASDVWGHEASGFTPWLANNLNLLSDALQIDELELIGTEISTGDFRLDVLAEDGFGNPVVIENQFGLTDHKHLGQLIAYVASQGKPTTTIWVAERFKENHRASIDWLNSSTSEDYNFFAVEIEALKIGDSDPAPFFNLVAKPNLWTKKTRLQSAASSAQNGDRFSNRLAFWTSFSEFLRAQGSRLAIRNPGTNHSQNFAIGRAGVHLSATLVPMKKRVGVELYIARDAAKMAFNALYAQRDAIDAIIPHTLEWQELPGKKASRIVAFKSGVDARDDAQWPEIQSWMASMLEHFRLAFTERARTLELSTIPNYEELLGDESED